MSSDNGIGGSSMGKQEDMDMMDDGRSPGDKGGLKGISKALNRVSRACNACRKQKMRCEGAENPPCKRCKNSGLECMFEKPSREASLTGEAGLERIRSLENTVADIRQAQVVVQNSLDEILAHIRGGGGSQTLSTRSASYPPHYVQQSPIQSSPSMHSQGSMSTPTPGPPQLLVDTSHGMPPPPAPYASAHNSLAPIMGSSQRPPNDSAYRSPPQSASGSQALHHALPPPGSGYPQGFPGVQGPTLPPISSLQSMGGLGPPGVRFHPQDHIQQQQQQQQLHSHPHAPGVSSSLKRPISISAVTSADSSDVDEEDDGELPREGMVAPWEVLRGLADVAIERAKKENINDSAPPSRARTPSPDPKHPRASKRRKYSHKITRAPSFPDVVTKKIISESEARELFRLFYHGCSTFLPVFDQKYDTYDALHQRSPFAVNCICMVAALIRDKGGKPSDTYLRCLEEVQSISQASLFSPVTRLEAVQSMLLVAGWSESGWLPGGHAVRMAMELSMHKAWPKLLKRMRAGKAQQYDDDRTLVAAVRTWLSLYIFEHQISYGTGRPAILKDDESIAGCRQLLDHPLAVEDDMRLVSTVELMAVRERVTNKLSPLERPIDDVTFQVLHEADQEFQVWYRNWDAPFSQKYEDAAFYRQSLQIQHMHAELFHNSNALRNINGPEDVQKMPLAQRELALRSIRIARHSLEITLNSPAYREGMKYAVHYTHATATFTGSLLLRLARLFPDECPLEEARTAVQRLASLMSEIPAKRYSLTLKLMLKRSKQRRQASLSRSPSTHDHHRMHAVRSDSTGSITMSQHHGGMSQEPFSPTYHGFPSPEGLMQPQMPHGVSHLPTHFAADAANLDQIWRGFETAPSDQVPVWLSDQSLGGNSFTQNGMNAFLLPQDYMPPAPQIW